MIILSTGPVERGTDTDRVRVLAFNAGRCGPAPVKVVIRDLSWPCAGGGRVLFARTRLVPPRRAAVFDADLGSASRYEVRAYTPSGRMLFYVSGYRPARWWPGTVADPATTFRHTELVRLAPAVRLTVGPARRPVRARGAQAAAVSRTNARGVTLWLKA